MFGQGDAKKCDYPLKESAAIVPFVVAATSICGVFQSITHIICSFKFLGGIAKGCWVMRECLS